MKISPCCALYLLLCFSIQRSAAELSPDTLSRESAAFSWNAYKALKAEPGRNVFFSTFYIRSALSMLLLGSSGPTEDDLLLVLELQKCVNKDLMKQGFHDEAVLLSKEKEINLTVADRFFVAENLVDKINPIYAADVKQYYNTTLKSTPFSTDSNGSRQMIDNFVAQRTKGKIPQFLSKDLPESTKLVLVDAVYFEGLWTTAFRLNDESDTVFHTADGDVQADFMKLPEQQLRYATCPNYECQLVVVPYTQTKKFNMIIVVPNESVNLSEWEDAMDIQQLISIWKNATSDDVQLKMPRFSLDDHFSLKDMLTNLGATHIFGDAGTANSLIFTEDEGLLIDDVIHESKITVNEAGIKLAGLKELDGSIIRVELNRPFIFFIEEAIKECVIFWGRVADPTRST